MNDVNLRYLDLLLKHFEPHQYHLVTLSELEAVICTSRRNVSIVMKKLATYDWVDWQPAIGRSNASRLSINISLQQAMTEFLVEELGRGRMNSITKLIDWFGQTAVRALTIASEKVNRLNESNNAILISSYPWVSKIDPANTYRHTELHVAKSVYDVLLTQNSNGGIEPSLAHEWKMEGKVMTLWLRPGIYRHDGEPLNIQDVVWSIERLREIKGPVHELWQCIDSVVAETSNCLKIILKHPNKLFPYMLATPHASILCRDVVPFGSSYSYHIGTGPFKISGWNQESMTLEAHKEYFSARALLDQITLSHGDVKTLNMLSFNQSSDHVEVEKISAFSYLTYRERAESQLTKETWYQLADYIHVQKRIYDAPSAVDSIQLETHEQDLSITDGVVIPKLKGKVVLAEPVWTIPSLIRHSEWLHSVIRATGLELEIVVIDDISFPEVVSHQADLLFIEEVMEAPFEYGIFEWLSIATGLRFSFDQSQMLRHREKVRRAMADDHSLQSLLNLEKALRDQYLYLPLFVGYEEVTKTQQVRGVQVKNTGYSDLHRLWIAHSH
ncbi:ABC transporter substrate-binding protein [Vibrio sp. 7-5(1-a)]|uniref:ABC transporter substrate-binding protein n=1 Tax=unclassified Vibrio TaxID=2614977 RepID=UPI001482CF72|nr:SgrR family transcriptional regulator [Vibrio alginolyticus]NNN38563.1 transporter [Vibrio sp. 2-2(2)]NNO03782.1 transporter [Vibrio sp. 7-5(1-a)]